MAWPCWRMSSCFSLSGLPGCDMDLLLHDVDPCHHFRYRMLHLDAGVHLEEIEIKVLVDEEFDGAGIVVSDLPADPDSGLAHLLPDLRGEGRGGRLFDDLLVPALDRAFTLEQMDHVAVVVAEDLHFDVPGLIDVFFDVNRFVAEIGHRLAAGRFDGFARTLLAVDDRIPFPPPPAAAFRRTGNPTLCAVFMSSAGVPGDTFGYRDAGLLCKFPGLDLVAHHHAWHAHRGR